MTACKTIGLVMIFASCTLAGVKQSRRLQRRTALLGEMARFLSAVQAELTYRRNRSLSLLRKAARAERYTELRLEFSEGLTPPESVNFALAEFCTAAQALITEQEREVFASAVRCIGAQAGAEQTEQLRAAQLRLEQAKLCAEEKAEGEAKIFRTLGICAGCAAVLFLL